jgi:hypothetical protein
MGERRGEVHKEDWWKKLRGRDHLVTLVEVSY